MNRFLSRSLLFLALFPAFSLAAHSQNIPPSTISPLPLGQKLRLPGLPNAGKVSDSLFRGAQPRADGFAQLKKLGITTIVDLRDEDAGTLAWERQQAEAAAIHFVNIPVNGWNTPSNDQLAQFLSLFKDPNEKIFVHCRFGEDRTGVFVAAYRMAHDRWPPRQAIKEMYFFGFNGFWHPSMKSFVDDFPSKLKTAPALSPFEKSM